MLYLKSKKISFHSHTGLLEVFHNTLLMYISKRFSYRFVFSNLIITCTINFELLFLVMVVMSRVLLGIIDHNSHVDVPYKLKPDGTPQYHRVWRSNRWDTIPVKEKNQYTYITELLVLILKHGTQHVLSLRNITGRKRYGSSITPEAPPETATIAASKKSRFGTS